MTSNIPLIRELPRFRPWIQLSAEDDDSYKLFLVYRNQGIHRTLKAVWRMLDPDPETGKKPYGRKKLKSLCFDYRWDERAGAWDNEIDFSELENSPDAHLSDIQAHRRSIDGIGHALMTLGDSMLNDLSVAWNTNIFEVNDPQVFVKLLKAATDAIQTGIDARERAMGIDALAQHLEDQLRAEEQSQQL